MMDGHEQKVKYISAAVADFYTRKQPFYIYHGSTNSTRHLQFKQSETLDVSMLDEVLEIDINKQAAIVEPNVPMDKLVAATLAQGLVPKVVMEFPGITVGGGIQGFAGESSSFKHGVFNATCEAVEMVLGDGEIVTASRSQNSDLFYGAAGSFGSLGVLTRATIDLLPAKKYVALTYVPVASFDEAAKTTERLARGSDYDYIDGIMFSKDNGVIMLGRLSEEKIGPLARFTRAHDNWFYLHAQKISERRTKHTESIPLTDYLFRYDRGAFWMGRYALERAHWSSNRLSRWLFDSPLHTRRLYLGLHASGIAQQHIIQDVVLPVSSTVKFMNYVDRKFKTYPLWLCPLKLEKDWIMMRPESSEMVINVGVWDGHPFLNYDEFVAANRQLEAKLRELGGQKWFYAHAYYTEDEFWDIYNKPRYTALRRKYHAETLPNVYEKIRTKGRKPVHIKRVSFLTVFNLARLKVEK